MAVTVTPDAEALVGSYLRDRAEITALVGDRVGGSTPRNLDQAWVRITQIYDTPEAKTPFVHLVAVHLQIDCYGSASRDTMHAEASLLGRTVRAVLDDMPGQHDQGVVSAVTFGSLKRLPDTSLEVARERFILDANVYLHP